jgi:hypothetical protein
MISSISTQDEVYSKSQGACKTTVMVWEIIDSPDISLPKFPRLNKGAVKLNRVNGQRMPSQRIVLHGVSVRLWECPD